MHKSKLTNLRYTIEAFLQCRRLEQGSNNPHAPRVVMILRCLTTLWPFPHSPHGVSLLA